MKHLGRFCAGIVLALSLTLSAYAGHIPCGITDEPPASEATAAGDISCGLTGDMPNGVESTDAVTELVLSLLNLLSLI
jgi:hypothetical protein